jgi:ribonuclease P protein component
VRSASFALFGMPNDLEESRIGLTVPRRVGPAHVRNRVKRALREIFRLHRDTVSPTLDVVVNAYPGIAALPRTELEREVLARLRQLAARCRK